jgi:hypothetical protein
MTIKKPDLAKQKYFNSKYTTPNGSLYNAKDDKGLKNVRILDND